MSDIAEEVGRCLVSVLGVPASEVRPDRRLHELGLESFTAVGLHRRLAERTGARVPLQAFVGATVQSLIDEVGARRGGREPEREPIAPPPADLPLSVDTDVDEMPLTPIQAAYWVGREPGLPLGGVATYYYFEFDRRSAQFVAHNPVDEVEALEVAWNEVVQRHEMLRAVVTDDGHQRVLPTVDRYRIGVTDLRSRPAQADAALERLRAARSHQVHDTGIWPLFDIHVAMLPEGGLRVFVGFDIIVLDMASWILLMRQWGDLVADPGRTVPTTGSSFLQILSDRDRPALRERWQRDRHYWLASAQALPAGPALPHVRPIEELSGHRFHRHAAELDVQRWTALADKCAARGLSPTAVLLAAFAVTLHRWGATDAFCLNVTLFDRPDSAHSAGVVGDFSTTALVAIPTADPLSWTGFAEFAHRVNTRFWADLEHRSFSGIEVQRAQAPDPHPRYPIVFTSGVGLGQGDSAAAGWIGDEVYGVSQTPQVLLDHIVWDEAGRLRLAWDAVTEAFSPGFVDGMLASHLRLLETLAVEKDSWERIDLGWNPHMEMPQPLPDRVRPNAGPALDDPQRQIAHSRPDTGAVYGSSSTVTHTQLCDRAAALGARLVADGVRPGDRVAVVLPKSPIQVVAVYGVLWAGATFVPIEPDWPAARVASVCARADIRCVLVGSDDHVQVPPTVGVHRLGDEIPRGAPEVDKVVTEPGDLAYIIFTSGSTGEPKGVAVEHRAARTTIDDVNDRFGIGASDRVLALSALSFDLSIYDVFGVLGAGGALVLPDVARQRDPSHWCELIAEHRVTVWNTAPAVAEMLIEYAEADPAAAARLASLRLMLLSGDWIPVTLPDRLRAVVPGLRVISLGGATEAAIWSIHYPIDQVDPAWSSIPYGRALRDQYFLVLDDDGRPCPVGTAGELHIGGAGLARGYAGDEEQTARRFARHPRTNERLYRTGDLGRWCTDGTLEFLGRSDRQVKVRGHRIELGEIEAVVGRLPGIRACVAAALPGADGRARLVAYVVGRGASPPVPGQLAARARATLPQYMVPTHWVVLDAIPLTANGKVDQTNLPNPFRTDDSSSATQARPRGSAATADSDGRATESGRATVERADAATANSADPRMRAERDTGQPDSSDWLALAYHHATAGGLGLSLRLTPGSAEGSAALLAAVDCVEKLREDAAERGVRLIEKVGDGAGIIELVIERDDAGPAPFRRPSSDPGALIQPGTATPERATPGIASDGDAAEPVAASAPGAVDVLPVRGADNPVHAGAAIEPVVRQVFTEILGCEVPATTPFHDLGATSMTLVVAHRKLRSHAPALTVLDLFQHGSARDLADWIARTSGRPKAGESLRPGAGPSIDLAGSIARGQRRRTNHSKVRQTTHVVG